MRSKTVKEKRSLVQYARDLRKKDCPVCDLTPEVRTQLKEASTKKISMTTQLEWLRDEIGLTVTAQQLNSHRGGRHEESA